MSTPAARLREQLAAIGRVKEATVRAETSFGSYARRGSCGA